MTDLYAKKGVKFLGWTEVGNIDLWGKKPYYAPSDLNGVKAASYANKTQQLFFTSHGANPIPLGLPEWIPAFQTGLAEVVFTTITWCQVQPGRVHHVDARRRLGHDDADYFAGRHLQRFRHRH